MQDIILELYCKVCINLNKQKHTLKKHIKFINQFMEKIINKFYFDYG